MTSALQALRKEFKARGIPEFCYDVYSDRVNFYGSDHYNLYYTVLELDRGAMIDRDRSGYSISREDAARLGIPTEKI